MSSRDDSQRFKTPVAPARQERYTASTNRVQEYLDMQAGDPGVEPPTS